MHLSGWTLEESGQTLYALELTWKPPNWGARDATGFNIEVRDGQTVHPKSTIHFPAGLRVRSIPFTHGFRTSAGRRA